MGQPLYCHDECYKKQYGESIETTNIKKNLINLCGLIFSFSVYYFVSNIYLCMLFYFWLCSYFIKVYLEPRNDLFILIAVFILPLIPPDFSFSYRFFLIGALLSVFWDNSYNPTQRMGRIRRKYGGIVSNIGTVLAIVGIGMGIYSILQ